MIIRKEIWDFLDYYALLVDGNYWREFWQRASEKLSTDDFSTILKMCDGAKINCQPDWIFQDRKKKGKDFSDIIFTYNMSAKDASDLLDQHLDQFTRDISPLNYQKLTYSDVCEKFPTISSLDPIPDNAELINVQIGFITALGMIFNAITFTFALNKQQLFTAVTTSDLSKKAIFFDYIHKVGFAYNREEINGYLDLIESQTLDDLH